MSDSDAALLDAWREGDKQAGMRLYDRHAKAVSRFFESKLRGGTEDLIQQTFERLIESRERIRDGFAFRAFLLGIARNVLREHLRSLDKDRQIDPEVDSMASLDPGLSTLVGTRREHRLLLEALRRLPLEHQIGLELFYWESLTAAQIGEILGVPHSTMRSRLIKARELLREAMAELSQSKDPLESTGEGLDGWAAQVRKQLGDETS